MRVFVALIVTLLLAALLVGAGSKEYNRWLPLSYIVGNWNVRPTGSDLVDMFHLPPFTLEVNRAGMVHPGVLVGTLGIEKNAKFFTHSLLEAVVGSDDAQEREKAQASVVNDSMVAPDLFSVPFRLETDSSLMGGSIVVGEGHEFEEEEDDFVVVKGPLDDDDEDSTSEKKDAAERREAKQKENEQRNAEKKVTRDAVAKLTTSYQFHQSGGEFHPFKTMSGKCPTMEEVEGTVGPLADWFRLIKESTSASALAAAAASAEKPDDEGEPGVAPARWRWCKTYQVTVLGQDNFIVTIVLSDGNLSTLSARRSALPTGANKKMETFGYTILFLLFVAAVKFGPKYYFKWKGVDPNMFQPGSKLDSLRKKVEKMTPEERKELLAAQRKILLQMEKDGLISQEKEQKVLAKEAE